MPIGRSIATTHYAVAANPVCHVLATNQAIVNPIEFVADVGEHRRQNAAATGSGAGTTRDRRPSCRRTANMTATALPPAPLPNTSRATGLTC